MLTIYRAKAHLQNYLSETNGFNEINRKVLTYLTELLLDILNAESSDLAYSELQKKIVQSSRSLYIGCEDSKDRLRAISDISCFLKALLAEKQEVRIARLDSDDDNSVEISLSHVDCDSDLTVKLVVERHSAIHRGPGTINCQVSILNYRKPLPNKIDVIEVNYSGNISTATENLLSYLTSVRELGVEHDYSGWSVIKLGEIETNRLIADLLKTGSNSCIEEEEWSSLDTVISDDVQILDLSDNLSFEECLAAFPLLSDYWIPFYQYDVDGHAFGQTVANVVLQSALILADCQEQIAAVAQTFVENIDSQDMVETAESSLNETLYFSVNDHTDISEECLLVRKQFLESVKQAEDEDDGW
ncbi:hypothetical protein [Vibrio agarivorans]|uniref:Uncharacterized protein n=1 Tax=Vibrio agarivorans TaxID=153622 RepID=A0ABT7Y7P9_9VIBR|nr:hypothetical protein [Vibrio agarivorans]MDN2483995.1 hypothetical protein [Vibrio agarivorans]